MKKVYSLVFLMAMAMKSLALPVDVNTAAKSASSILGKEVVSGESLTNRVRARVSSTSAAPAYYVFNAEDGNGFVILSAETEMPEVVGYSFDNSFDADNMSPALDGYLSTYTEFVDAVRSGDAEAPAGNNIQRRAKAVVAPLCEVEWGQGAPYNALCPVIGGEYCPVGCVATAMAQIMYHHQWPKVGAGKMTYATGITGFTPLSSNFAQHEYDWSIMRSTAKENQESEASAAAVAQLSFDCGVASKMNYEVDGSGTYDDLAMKALYTYFGYKASTLRVERRSCYATQEEWNDLVKSELDASRPVLYGGYTPAPVSGHEFIIDGYDSDGMFHVNWGWDGSSNGYYSIVTLQPKRSSSRFSDNQTMVCGIEPDFEGTDKTAHQFRIEQIEASSITAETVALGDAFYFIPGTYYNHSNTALTWTVAAALYDAQGNQLALLSSKTAKKYTELIRSYYYGTCSSITCRLPNDLADGFYYIRFVTCQNGYEDFILVDMRGGSELNKIPVIVKDGVATFNEVPTSVQSVQAAISVVSTDLFTLDGRKASANAKGTVIERKRMSDGSVIVNKIYKR